MHIGNTIYSFNTFKKQELEHLKPQQTFSNLKKARIVHTGSNTNIYPNLYLVIDPQRHISGINSHCSKTGPQHDAVTTMLKSWYAILHTILVIEVR